MKNSIISLTVQNLLRIKLAEVKPDGAVVIVAGKNDMGKSSLLNSIALALSGKDLPAAPIRRGATSGQVILETESLVITRKFSQAGGSSLEVRDRDGAKLTSPQAKLDALVSRVTFDPFEFTRIEPAKQLETLKKIVGLDFTTLDAERARKYDERTTMNRQVRDAQGLARNIQRFPDAPKEEVSVASLTEELTRAHEKNAENDDIREFLELKQETLDEQVQRRGLIDDEIAELKRRLSDAEHRLLTAIQNEATATKDRDTARVRIEGLVDVPTDSIMARMREVDTVNAQVRSNAQWDKARAQVVTLERDAASLTRRIEEIDTEKSALLAKVQFPVPGLGFDEQGVTFNGLPFAQAGTAVKIRTSVAIARALSPAMPVMLVRDGSLLDPESMALLTQEAESQGLQIWMEVVGSREDATVVIEDGEVVDRPASRKKKDAEAATTIA